MGRCGDVTTEVKGELWGRAERPLKGKRVCFVWEQLFVQPGEVQNLLHLHLHPRGGVLQKLADHHLAFLHCVELVAPKAHEDILPQAFEAEVDNVPSVVKCPLLRPSGADGAFFAEFRVGAHLGRGREGERGWGVSRIEVCFVVAGVGDRQQGGVKKGQKKKRRKFELSNTKIPLVNSVPFGTKNDRLKKKLDKRVIWLRKGG